MISPINSDVLRGASAEVHENPACELFPASRVVGRLFAAGIVLGFAGLFLDGMGATALGWASIAAGGLTLLYAGGRVVR